MVEAAPQAAVLTFAAAADWHPGVIGIVASRLRERYERPALVIALDGGVGRGSGRSIPGVALGPAVIAARQTGLLINGGGHAMAAGFTVAADKLDALREFLVERLGDGLDQQSLVPELIVDGALSAAAAQSELIGHIDRLAPFGAANPEPRFVFPALRVLHAEMVGGAHLRCSLADLFDGARLPAIAFQVGETPLGRFLAETRGAGNPHRRPSAPRTPGAAATRCSWSSTTRHRFPPELDANVSGTCTSRDAGAWTSPVERQWVRLAAASATSQSGSGAPI